MSLVAQVLPYLLVGRLDGVLLQGALVELARAARVLRHHGGLGHDAVVGLVVLVDDGGRAVVREGGGGVLVDDGRLAVDGALVALVRGGRVHGVPVLDHHGGDAVAVLQGRTCKYAYNIKETG